MNRAFHLTAIERFHHFTLSTHTLLDFAGVLERRRRIRFDHDNPSGQWSRGLRARQVQDLLETLGREQTHACPFTLQHRIGGHRGSVHEVRNVVG